MERSMATPARKLTYEDHVLFPDDGKLHEIIDGEHFVTAAPVARHQAVLRDLAFELLSQIRERDLGELFFAPLDVILSDVDVVEPDLLFVRREREEIIDDSVRGAPDLVVEILSPSTRGRDERLKRDLYERFGVGEYWVVDPDAETVKVYRLEGGAYGRPELLIAERGDTLSSPLFGELEVPLERVFRTAERRS